MYNVKKNSVLTFPYIVVSEKTLDLGEIVSKFYILFVKIVFALKKKKSTNDTTKSKFLKDYTHLYIYIYIYIPCS